MTSNKKKFLVVVAVVLTFFGLLTWRTINKVESDRATRKLIQKLPEMPFQYLQAGNISEHKPVVVIFFSPDCDHCQRTAIELIALKSKLSRFQIVMVTQSSLTETQGFYKKYSLSQLPNLRVGIDKNFEFYKYFGNANVPSFYIYDKNHSLVKKIQGETNIDQISKLVE